MIKHFSCSAVCVFFVFIFFAGCHTYIFQPVKKQLVGKWKLSESDTSREEIWEFNGSCLTITVNGTVRNFTNPTSGDSTTCMDYRLENKLTKHYLYTDAFWGTSPEEVGRWLVVKVNKKVLYLSSEHQKKIKGSFQKGFTRI